jgi:hypothetical protein
MDTVEGIREQKVVERSRRATKELMLFSEQKMQYQRDGEFDSSEVVGGEDRLGINRELREDWPPRLS